MPGPGYSHSMKYPNQIKPKSQVKHQKPTLHPKGNRVHFFHKLGIQLIIYIKRQVLRCARVLRCVRIRVGVNRCSCWLQAYKPQTFGMSSWKRNRESRVTFLVQLSQTASICYQKKCQVVPFQCQNQLRRLCRKPLKVKLVTSGRVRSPQNITGDCKF